MVPEEDREDHRGDPRGLSDREEDHEGQEVQEAEDEPRDLWDHEGEDREGQVAGHQDGPRAQGLEEEEGLEAREEGDYCDGGDVRRDPFWIGCEDGLCCCCLRMEKVKVLNNHVALDLGGGVGTGPQ